MLFIAKKHGVSPFVSYVGPVSNKLKITFNHIFFKKSYKKFLFIRVLFVSFLGITSLPPDQHNGYVKTRKNLRSRETLTTVAGHLQSDAFCTTFADVHEENAAHMQGAHFSRHLVHVHARLEVTARINFRKAT